MMNEGEKGSVTIPGMGATYLQAIRPQARQEDTMESQVTKLTKGHVTVETHGWLDAACMKHQDNLTSLDAGCRKHQDNLTCLDTGCIT